MTICGESEPSNYVIIVYLIGFLSFRFSLSAWRREREDHFLLVSNHLQKLNLNASSKRPPSIIRVGEMGINFHFILFLLFFLVFFESK